MDYYGNSYNQNQQNQEQNGSRNYGSWNYPQQTAPGSSAQYYWDGNTYRAVYQNVQRPSAPAPEVKKQKKGGKIALFVLIGLLCCALVSGGSIAGFVALVNNGTIQLQNTSVSEIQPAYTITKLISSETSPVSDETAGKLSESEIAEKVLPSIVLIENYQISSNRYGFGYGYSNDELTPAGEGSGIIASSDGYIITNAHVVAGASSLKVVTYEGERYEAKLIGSDTVTDVALVKIEADNLPAAEFGSSSDLKVGEKVLTAGNPGGSEFNFSITVGYVSALNRAVTNGETGYSMDCIQTDAAVNPGNSGGALVNEYGQVVGIVSSKIVSEYYEGLGFAIPIDDAQGIVTNLKTYGYVKDRAALGVSGQFIDELTARFYGLTQGWYVYSVSNPSLSDAGIQKGDIITEIDGKEVTSSAVLSKYLLTKKPGDTVKIKVARGSDSFEAQVKLIQVQNE